MRPTQRPARRLALRVCGICGPAALLCALLAPAAFADRLKLKDGTVLDGTVLPRADGYWIKTADGNARTVATAEVASYEKGDPLRGTTCATVLTGASDHHFLAVEKVRAGS